MSDFVRATFEGDVGILTIQNPPVNALNSRVAQSLATAVAQLGRNDWVRSIVVVGSGQTFIAGADIRELFDIAADPSAKLDLLPALQAIEDSSKPIVMAIHGAALGGGLETAMCGHYRIATAEAQLGMPEVKLGLIPGGGGTQRLPRLAGAVAAAEMCVTGNPVGAHDALALGVIDRIAAPDLLRSAVDFAREVAAQLFLRTRDRNGKLLEADRSRMADMRQRFDQGDPRSSAPLAALAAIETSLGLDWERGIQREAELFNRVLHSTEARSLIHLFFAERAAGKAPSTGGDKRYQIRKVAVVGAGTMGRGIAMALANSNIPVVLKERAQEPLDRGMAAIQSNYDRTVAGGRLDAKTAQERLSRIKPQVDYAGFEDVDLAIEAVFEDLTVKREVMAELGKFTRADCLLATNTSSLNVDEIAAPSDRSNSSLGLHFFSPANLMRLLEVVPGRSTSPDVMGAVMALGKRLGKLTVLAGNESGFIGNRVFRPYLREARFLVEEGASVEEVNSALVNWGMSMGPLSVDDLIGIDVSRHIEEQFRKKDPSGVRRSALLEALFERGDYGQKTGKGWSTYDETRKPTPNPEVASLADNVAAAFSLRRRSIDAAEVVDRCLCALINEGARVLGEGIARRASDIDVVFVHGYGFPSWRGGPMFHADLRGLDVVLRKIREFEDRFGAALWTPAPLLVELAEKRRSFSETELTR